MTIGERIKEIRMAKEMTQKQLADKLGVSYVNISQWENGIRNPKIETLKKISNVLEVPVDSLLDIAPLPEKEGVEDSATQELFAVLGFLKSMGYVLLNTIQENAAAVILDRRKNVWYEIPIEKLSLVEDNIMAFSKYQIHTMLSDFTPFTHYKRNDTFTED